MASGGWGTAGGSSAATARDLFCRAAGYAFDEWDVVKKALEEEWGGDHTEEMVEWMKEVVANWFFEIPDDPPTAEEVAEYIGQIFVNEFSVVSDGSIASDIALHLVDLFKLQEPDKINQLIDYCKNREAKMIEIAKKAEQAKEQRKQHRVAKQTTVTVNADDDDIEGDGWTVVGRKPKANSNEHQNLPTHSYVNSEVPQEIIPEHNNGDVVMVDKRSIENEIENLQLDE